MKGKILLPAVVSLIIVISSAIIYLQYRIAEVFAFNNSLIFKEIVVSLLLTLVFWIIQFIPKHRLPLTIVLGCIFLTLGAYSIASAWRINNSLKAIDMQLQDPNMKNWWWIIQMFRNEAVNNIPLYFLFGLVNLLTGIVVSVSTKIERGIFTVDSVRVAVATGILIPPSTIYAGGGGGLTVTDFDI